MDVVRSFIPKVGTAAADEYWGDSAVLEIPYAPPPWPTKISGRESVLEYMGGVHHVLRGWHMGIDTLYDVLVVGTVAYAASYAARGWLAGHEYFALYGGLVVMESLSRLCFALAVALGIASGQTAVALGIAAAPLVSLIVVPAAFARRGQERREALVSSPRAVHHADAALDSP